MQTRVVRSPSQHFFKEMPPSGAACLADGLMMEVYRTDKYANAGCRLTAINCGWKEFMVVVVSVKNMDHLYM